jgi:hypothetical protein
MPTPGQLPELREDTSDASRKAIQETTFSKDVLARYVCNTLDEVKAAAATPATEFTAIVIGSGMYGAFCAERVYRRGGRALVLDAGPFVVSEHVQNMADPAFDVAEAEDLLGKPAFGEFRSPAVNDDAKTPIDYAGHNYNVGGKSVRWGGWSPRLTEEDLALWPAAMADYLRDNYREIEFQIGAFPTADYIRGPLAEAVFERVQKLKGKHDIVAVLPAPIAVQAEQPASGLFSFDKFSSLPLLIESLRADARGADGNSQSPADANSRRALMLVPRCRVLRLETAPVGGGKLRVTHLRVVHGSGPNRRFDLIPVPAGCQVVLAANSLESTRLALESFVPPGPDGRHPDRPQPPGPPPHGHHRPRPAGRVRGGPEEGGPAAGEGRGRGPLAARPARPAARGGPGGRRPPDPPDGRPAHPVLDREAAVPPPTDRGQRPGG